MRLTYIQEAKENAGIWIIRPVIVLACLFLMGESICRGIDAPMDREVEEAVLLQNTGKLRAALKAGASADSLDSTGEPLIVRAFLLGNYGIASDLLANGANARCRSKHGAMGDTLVLIGMNKKRGDLIDLAIRYGADDEGFTPLMIAMIKRDTEMVQRLLLGGADVNVTNRYRRTALSFAIPDRELVRLLFNRGAKHSFSRFQIHCILNETNELSAEIRKPNGVPVPEKAAGLYWAIVFNSLGSVQILKNNRVPDKLPEWSFRTPVGLAAENGHLEILKLLVASGGDVDEKNEEIFTPLMLAYQHGQTSCVDFLLPLSKEKALSPSENKK